jgi:signal peptidase I
MTSVGSDAMAPALRAREAAFFAPYSETNTVQRGDVVVFHIAAAGQGPTRHIFRAIGLPGETVQLIDGVVHIDGKPMGLVATDDVFVWDSGNTTLNLFRETTPEGRSYLVARDMSGPPYLATAENAGPFVVPDGHILVLGDNRHNAADSRYPDQMGGGSPFIGLDQLVGKVELIYLSPDPARTGRLIDAR